MEKIIQIITLVLTIIVLLVAFYLIAKGYVFIVEYMAKLIIGVI